MSVSTIEKSEKIGQEKKEIEIYTYEEALDASLEYFEGDDLAAKVFLDKYALRDNDQNLLEKTPTDMHWRIAHEFARIEAKKFKNPMSVEEIFSYLDRYRYIVPQGSPMYGIGNNFQTISLSNCYVLDSPLDSYGGIHRTDEQLSQISKRRGGVGIDITHLRPNGSTTHNAARTSTGITSFMERFSNSIREVGQSGRRGALMLTISCHHPEVIEFASIKKDLSKVTGANISIRFSDEFLKAVDNNEDYELRWPVDARENGEEPSISKKVNAGEVWDKIVESAHGMAEPGILFWDNIIKESPSDCYADLGFRTICTNPCSEIPLSALDSCRLLLQNLLSYVENPWTDKAKFNYKKFNEHAQIAQRLMDNLIDLELEKIDAIIAKVHADPEPMAVKQVEIDMWEGVKAACLNGRRTGTGITAIGDAMAACGIRYGSKESIKFTNKIYKNLKLSCYRSSVEMAKELGPFPIYDAKREEDCPFIQRIAKEDPDLYADMVRYGRRNIALLTTAPAGSVSIQTRTTSGIEPLFMAFYTRKKKINPNDQNARCDEVDQNGDHWQHFFVVHPRFKEWIVASGRDLPDFGGDPAVVEKELNSLFKESPWFEACAEDLEWTSRVDIQAIANKHVDHAISSTLNLPEDVTVEKVKEIYARAWKSGCKGITVYRNNCRSGVMVSTADKNKDESRITKTDAPKRPKDLPSDVHHTRVKGEEYFVMVGKLENEPYEVFAGKNGFMSKSVKSAIVSKIKRGHYQAVLDNGEVIENIAEHISDDQEAITRVASCSLRHGVDISYLVHQLEKTKGEMQSFAKATARCLKKHIEDGKKVSGEECPSCSNANLQRRDGCVTCMDCGWSRCS